MRCSLGLVTWAVLISFILIACGGPSSTPPKPVLHLFSDARLAASENILQLPAGTGKLKSILTYPHDDALWVVPWQGKKALRFESTVAGDLRGSFYLFRDLEKPDFRLRLASWLDDTVPESWTGVIFGMQPKIDRALGVRWRVVNAQQKLEVQIFFYNRPELNPIIGRVLSYDRPHWADIELAVQGKVIQFRIDGQEVLAGDVPQEWQAGTFMGFYQGLGTGYFADLVLDTGGAPITYDELFDHWNEEMVHTTRKVLLESFTVPDEFTSKEIPIRRVAIAGEWRTVVPVHCPSQLVFEIRVPGNAQLHVGYGILPPFAIASVTAEFQVLVFDKEKGRESLLASRVMNPRASPVRDFRFHDFHLSLREYAGREVFLRFKVLRQGGDEPLVVCWSEPLLATVPVRKPMNVLFVMLDTLRADRVGVYGNPRGLTPHIDQLARNGAVFLNTIAQAPWTTPSHASLFTSLYPSETNCANAATQGNVLQEGYVTWAEYFQRQGYSTAAFTSGIQIRGAVGFHQGFDLYQDVEYDKAYSLETIYQRLSRWLDHHGNEPWFLFAHTYAVHFPYKHQQYVDYRALPRNWDDQIQIDRDTYDGGARFADEWVGVLVRELRERGLFEDTLIIIASDHGEDLGEREMPRPAQHGHALYDEQLKVPLILHYPPKIPRGKTITKQVRLLDLLPTVLDLQGWPQTVASHGLSLLPLLRGEKEDERFAFSEGMTYGVAQVSVRTHTHKLIYMPDPNARLDDTPNKIPVPPREPVYLFDLTNDPEEKNNLAESQPEKRKELMRILEFIRQGSFKPEFFTEGSVIRELPQISPQLLEEMLNAGYVAK